MNHFTKFNMFSRTKQKAFSLHTFPKKRCYSSESLPCEMKSILMMKNGGNAREQLEYALVVTPDPPRSSEILIKVHAASINPIDASILSGFGSHLLERACPLPRALGRDCAGVVVQVGDTVTDFKVGDEVFGVNTIFQVGTHVEYVKINQNQATFKPEHLSMAEAASLGYAGMTAEAALGYINSNEEVLINGGSGGYGICLIQLLKSRNCKVHVTCSKKNFDKVLKYGADHVYDYNEPFHQSFEDSQIDIMFDSNVMNNDMVPFYIEKIKPKGHYINLHPFRFLAKQSMLGVFKNVVSDISVTGRFRKKGIVNGFLFSGPTAPLASRALAHISSTVSEGLLKPDVDKVFPLSEGIDAFEYFNSSHRSGKVVIDFTKE